MSVGQEFWIVAAGCPDGNTGKDTYYSNLQNARALGPANKGGVMKFDVPDGDKSLLFGSFDNLIRLTDDLAKNDNQVDSIVHRFERQYIELDPRAQFQVKTQRQDKPFLDYLKDWQWDEAKYPKTRSIQDNLQLLMSVVNKLDEEARNKTAQYNDLKTQRGNLAKKEGASLTSRDLVDVLTPEVVQMNGNPSDDFIYTEHLTTVCVILGRGGADEFLKSYEKMCDNVVPMSAKHFSKLDDKDGNMVWRVVVFKSAVENFKKACRERRCIPRDFEYSEDGYKKLKENREKIETAVKGQFDMVKRLYQAAWSDAMVAWIHIKAMRVFVESVLWYGMPPRFASFIVSAKGGSAAPARKALADILGKSGPNAKAEQGDDGEEVFPYVSMSFIPFAVARS